MFVTAGTDATAPLIVSSSSAFGQNPRWYSGSWAKILAKSITLPLVYTSTAYAPGSTAMMSGAWLWAASAALTPTRCSLSPGYAVISSERFGSKRFLYSSAMNRWALTWNPTYCQKESVVGALALTRGGLNSAGFFSSPDGAAGAAGWAPPT